MYGYISPGIDPHGGHCCGMLHIYNFPNATIHLVESGARPITPHKNVTLEEKVQWIEGVIEQGVCNQYNLYDYDEWDNPVQEVDQEKVKKWSCLVEAVLVSAQLRIWQKALEQIGFKKVNEFHNSNSGNVCHVFHFNHGGN